MNPEKISQPNGNEKNKIDYSRVLESIKTSNGRLKDIASRFLENPELLKIVPAQLNPDQRGYGMNSIGNTENEKIKIKGININPEHMTEEVAVTEIVHFFSIPAQYSAVESEKKKEFEKLAQNVKTYWQKTKALWDYAKSKGYEATNDHSIHDTIEEFAVNFTNEQSEQKLKELNVYKALVDSFFEYYQSLKIRQE